jgi:signal transduction histidine kinase/CheY-like chemotaxis protein
METDYFTTSGLSVTAGTDWPRGLGLSGRTHAETFFSERHHRAVTATPGRDSAQPFPILLVADDVDCAALVLASLEQLRDGTQLDCRWVTCIKDALDHILQVPIGVILCVLPADAQGFDCIDSLRQAGGDIPVVVITDSESTELCQRLHERGIEDYLVRCNIAPTSLQRIIGHAVERRKSGAKIEASLRRERLRGEILARIAGNAPLKDVLADLGEAVRREVNCAECGFAIELDDDSSNTVLWPEGNAAATQLANNALAYARLHPGRNDGLGNCEACVQAIRCGGRLLGELVLVPGSATAAQDAVRAYAMLGAELAAVAIDRHQTAECLRQSQEELRQLSARLLSIQETERQRIAGDLHDVIGQSLSVVKVTIEQAEQQYLNNGAPEVAAILGRLVPWVKTALSEVRRISMDLRPATIDDLGILPTLSWFFREFGASCANIAVEPRIAITEAEVPDALKIVIFRILQEAFSNIVKHAQATRIQVVLQGVGANMQLAVIDNGVGFNTTDQGRLNDGRSGLGLCSMRERARVSGGSYTLESTLGIGTTILVTWPLSG